MNTMRLFAKLTDKPADYSFMPFTDSPSNFNIALYTKGMYRKAYIAGRFVWSKDLSVHTELLKFITDGTELVAKREGWKLGACGDRIEILCELAMIEHYAPAIFKTEKAKYQYCGVPESKWFRLWGKRYEVPYGLIRSYLDIAWGSVHKKLAMASYTLKYQIACVRVSVLLYLFPDYHN